ncbi:MAG: hypothetical protein ACO3YM_01485 [Candidatus Kapaibacteriota bacterium]
MLELNFIDPFQHQSYGNFRNFQGIFSTMIFFPSVKWFLIRFAVQQLPSPIVTA